MKLITKAIQEKLDKNFAEGNNEDIPMKLFNPIGMAARLAISQAETALQVAKNGN